MVLYTCQMVITTDTKGAKMAYYGNEIEITFESFSLPWVGTSVRTGYVMPEGAVFLPNSDVPDEWFESINDVRGHGYSNVTSTELTEKSVMFDPDDIKKSLQMHKDHIGSIPECMAHWLQKELI